MSVTIKKYVPIDGGPGRGSIAVTPSDSVDLTDPARFLYIGTSGDVTLIDWQGTTTLFKNVPVGYLFCSAQRVKATGTTASNIVALT